jgi:hypothetical protein
MDPLTGLALVGTTRQSEPTAESGPPADPILASLSEVPMERRVLLAAGARTAAAMAGRRSLRSAEPVGVAPAETRPACSEKAARIVRDLLRGHHEELLPEALRLLARAGQRLPHALLPGALRVRGGELRAAVRPVLGERGAWLARMSETWSWAVAAPTSASFEELERAWTDGTAAARRELFTRARELDAPRARAWLEATWASEKADERAALLAGMLEGISADDEVFVEAQLRDRASSVREAAQTLLAHLPEGAFARRMTARADAMVDFKRSVLAFAGKRGSLVVTPPETMDQDAERDGLGKPPQGVGARAYWVARALAAVPVTHWTTRFGTAPKELVAAAEATDWASAVCEGWTRAALVTGDAAWLGALWEFFQRSDEKSVTPQVTAAMSVAILRRMTPADAAARVEQTLGNAGSRIDIGTALGSIPSPWPESLGMRWLAALQGELRSSSPPSRLLVTVRLAATALPAACFARALEPIELPEDTAPFWADPLAELTDVVRLRHDLVQEIAP